MENAVKALSMAASVLLSLLIIGLLTYSYNSMRLNEEAKIKRREEKEIETINTQFETYLSKKYLIGTEVLSVANLANDYNGYDYLNEGYQHIDLIVELSDRTVKINGEDSDLFKKEFKTVQKTDGTYKVQLYDAYQKDVAKVQAALDKQYTTKNGKKVFKEEYGYRGFNFWLQWINPGITETDINDLINYEDYKNFVIRYNQIAYPDLVLEPDDSRPKELWINALNYYNARKAMTDFSRLNFEVIFDEYKGEDGVQYDPTTGRISKIVIKELGS